MTDCINEIIEASGNVLSKREAAELLRKFNKQAQQFDPQTNMDTLDAVLSNMRDNMVTRGQALAVHARRIQLAERIKYDSMRRTVMARYEKFPAKGVKEAVYHLLFGSPDSRLGLVHIWQGAVSRFNGFLEAELRSTGMLDHWGDKETMTGAVRALFNSEVAGISPESQTIGGVLAKVKNLSVIRLNSVGSYVLDTPRVLLNARAADPARLRNYGRKNFIEFAKTLTLDKKYLAEVEDLDEHFGEVFDHLVNYGGYQAPTGTFDGVSRQVKETYKNLASSTSYDADLPFADADSFLKFFDEFSAEPLGAFVSRRVNQIGRSVGLMEAFGPTPQATMDKLLASLNENMSQEDAQHLLRGAGLDRALPNQTKTGKEKAIDLLKLPIKLLDRAFYDLHPDDLLAYMDGSTSAPIDTGFAKVGAAVRVWTSMASLGNGLFMQLTDLPIKMANLAKLGDDPLGGILSPITAFAQTLPNEERKLFYSYFGIGAEAMLHNMAHELGTVGGGPRALSRGMDMAFKLNGMAPFDRIQKQGNADFISRILAEALSDPEPHGNVIDMFRNYGFDDDELSRLAAAIGEVDGIKVVDPRILLDDTDSKLGEKFIGVMEDLVNSTTPTPSARERALIGRGGYGKAVRPGTGLGEALRMFYMFKSYPIMFRSRVFPRLLYDHGFAGTATTMASMLMFWYLGDSLKSLAQGKSPRDMSKPENWMTAALRSGLGGIYADLITADYHRNGMDLADVLAGPGIGKISDVLELGSATVKGEATPSYAVNHIKSITPVLNTFYFQAALDRALYYGILEGNDPGYMRRKDQELQERTGQGRIW